ncbi:MAG TPA: hypothetical protein VH040_09085 [Usitatibacter sp.]|jgi:hypothetical protein|nr:hypothetical protein [Usitatibacter sp.]
MDAAVIRRYLQPSPTLRWHPWAPLVAALLLLAFVFYLGASWGFNASSRMFGSGVVEANASDVFFRHDLEEKRPAEALRREAGKLDAAVERYARLATKPRGPFEKFRNALESRVFLRGMWPLESHDYAVKLAELRLSEYSATNPRWRATASWCDELHRYARGEHDLLADYTPVAEAYSRVLGRTVRAEELAPAVPGGKCAF